MKDFTEKHGRVGIMTNQPEGYDRNRPHAATSVCDREECQRDARFWVQGKTGEAAEFVRDGAA